MRKILYSMVALLLAGCIDVDDFGTYWDKGTKDAALVGTWEKLPQPVIMDSTSESKMIFTEKDDVLEMTFIEGKETDAERDIARSIIIKGVPFMMVKKMEAPLKPGGMLLRYEIDENGELSLYVPAKPAENPYIAEHKVNALKTDEDAVKVGTLTEDALTAIGEMAKTPGGFIETARYKKQ